MEQANNADDGTDRASEENTETVNFKPLDFKKIQEKIRENLRIEYIIIIILAGILLFLIADRQNLINTCNSYWIAELEKCRSPSKGLYITTIWGFMSRRD